MKYFILASLISIVGCSIETKDGCTSTGDKAQCEPTQTETPAPPPAPEQDPKTPPTKPPVRVVKCLASPEAGTGCVWAQVASGGSPLRIEGALFSDADELQRYITQLLVQLNVDVDKDSDGNYLTFKYPREITNNAFVSKFKATFLGEEIKNATVYPEQGHIIGSRMLPGDYSLRVYAAFDLVERDNSAAIVEEACLQLEARVVEITVSAGEQTLLKPIDTFTASIHNGSCKNLSSSFREVPLPSRQAEFQ